MTNHERVIERAAKFIAGCHRGDYIYSSPNIPSLVHMLEEMIEEIQSAHKRIKELEKPVIVEFPESAATVQPLEYRGPIIGY